jgi:hypothetical protein
MAHQITIASVPASQVDLQKSFLESDGYKVDVIDQGDGTFTLIGKRDEDRIEPVDKWPEPGK